MAPRTRLSFPTLPRNPLSFLWLGLLAVASCTGDPGPAQNVCASATPPPALICGLGACRILLQACDANGQPIAECPALGPHHDDVCGDGIDNDCDGVVDENDSGTCVCSANETKPCYTGAPATHNVGICVSGLQACSNGAWSNCMGDVLPTIEQANGLDDDCDGEIDEGVLCVEGEQKPCYGGMLGEVGVGPCKMGLADCINGAWGECVGQTLPHIDVCNGIDDDCDGIIDNKGVPGPLCPCYEGDIESCYTGPIETYNVGVCAAGTHECSGGKWGICKEQTTPTPETCNGLDDDCDGLVDNGELFDGLKNGDETDIDCGGTCAPKCMLSATCQVDADCESHFCEPMTKTCQ